MINFHVCNLIVFLLLFKPLLSERRIQNGKELTTDQRYLVYFVNSEKSNNAYHGWTCGGAIVTPYFMITAAACVEDVQYLYAIAGYRTHVEYENLNNDPCTREMKRRVVYTCVPKSYELDYEFVGKWSAIDIAVAKVDVPFDPHDTRFKSLCSYTPEPIKVNYEAKYQQPGTDAIVMGWGHLEKWRKPEDKTSYLQKRPHYASTEILTKTKCKQQYADFKNLQSIIDKYMICTTGWGNLDADGNLISRVKPTAEECNNENPYCFLRSVVNSTLPKNTTVEKSGRRQGICQNDHGGPLVTWVGGHQILIGVASVFRVNADSKCEGPYLFTSTQCNSAFLYCILNKNRRKGSLCDEEPKKRGFDMLHNYISWDKYSDGTRPTVDYGGIKMRPQVPINQFG